MAESAISQWTDPIAIVPALAVSSEIDPMDEGPAYNVAAMNQQAIRVRHMLLLQEQRQRHRESDPDDHPAHRDATHALGSVRARKAARDRAHRHDQDVRPV